MKFASLIWMLTETCDIAEMVLTYCIVHSLSVMVILNVRTPIAYQHGDYVTGMLTAPMGRMKKTVLELLMPIFLALAILNVKVGDVFILYKYVMEKLIAIFMMMPLT